MQFWSPAFLYGCPIPIRYTGDGRDVFPSLHWRDLPKGTKSLAIVMHDLDAAAPAGGGRNWTHWVVYDIPARVLAMSSSYLPPGAREGLNDVAGTVGWRGPSPPRGSTHRYLFDLAALDTVLGELLGAPTRAQLEAVMAGHVLGTARLVGMDGRPG